MGQVLVRVWMDNDMFISRLIFIKPGDEAVHPIANTAKGVVVE